MSNVKPSNDRRFGVVDYWDGKTYQVIVVLINVSTLDWVWFEDDLF